MSSSGLKLAMVNIGLVGVLSFPPLFADSENLGKPHFVPEAEAGEAGEITADDTATVPASLASRLLDATVRGICVGACTFINLVAAKGDNLEYTFGEAILLGGVAGTGSALYQFFNHLYLNMLSTAELTERGKIRNETFREISTQLETLAKGYVGGEVLYMLWFNTGVILFATDAMPTVSSLLASTFLGANAAFAAQQLFESSLSRQSRFAKITNPQDAKKIQWWADKVVAFWSVSATVATTGLVMGTYGSQTAVWILSIAGATNAIYNLVQRNVFKHSDRTEVLKRQKERLLKGPRSCFTAFLPWAW